MKRVALIGENSVEYVSTLIDIWNCGNCAVLIDWRIPFTTAIEMMREANVEQCSIEKRLIEKEDISGIKDIEFVIYERGSNSAQYLSNETYNKFQENYSQNEAVVIYSSGTTGKSKGIILSHFAINTNADAIIDYMQPNADDRIYMVRPLSHSSAITGELLVALKTHTPLLISTIAVHPRIILRNIISFNVTICCLNPTLLALATDEIEKTHYQLSSLRTIYVSGSVLNDNTYIRSHKAFSSIPIYNVYGLSEAAPRVTAQRAECCNSNSVGKPLRNVEVAVLYENGDDVPQGEYGTVCVKTPSIFSGYISGDKRASLRPGWLNTGDIGYWDENGELHIVGRADDMLIIDTHKIYPTEIEEKILQCDDVKECVVTSVKYNKIDLLACLYTGTQGAEKNIREYLTGKLPIYEIPRRYIYCRSIPRNNNGKISAKEVKAIIEQEMGSTT